MLHFMKRLSILSKTNLKTWQSKREAGIELASSTWKDEVLPLNYTRVGGGIAPPLFYLAIRKCT